MSRISEPVEDEGLGSAAFERVKDELEALPAEQLLRLNVDVQATARTILGALPKLRSLGAELNRRVPEFDPAVFDRLEDYVLALRHTHAGFQVATQRADSLPEVVREGRLLRRRLQLNARALAAFGLFDERKLEHLQGGSGFDDLAADLELLCQAMTDQWPRVAERSIATREDVRLASRLAIELSTLYGRRRTARAPIRAAAELRRRAFTALFRCYETIRAAVGFIRTSQGDLEEFAPKLYTGKSRRRRPRAEPAQPVSTTPPVTVDLSQALIPIRDSA